MEIKVPVLGESITEATVSKWFKAVGDAVAIDEPLVELETDKVTLEVPASAAGTLSEIVAAEGENVEVGALLAVIANGAAGAAAAAPAPEAAPDPEPAKSEQAPAPAEAAVGEPALSPSVRKLVAEHGLDPAAIPGTGKDGRLTKADILAHMKNTPTPAAEPESRPAAEAPEAPSAGRGEERVRMTRLRKRIAERLKEAQNTAAMLTTFNEVDMTEVMDVRSRLRDRFEKKHGVKLGFMSFFAKACMVALKEIPAVNAQIDGDEIVYRNYCDLGIAVGTEQGLVVPVLRDADGKTFAEIEKRIGELGRAARDGKLTMDDLTGGTFTITNGGVYGSLLSTPILNPPQSGILG
ncbi:MAG: 2-oxoglutarate dehydrogenase complex dihydrolipoyllysine-residue succinyltransferase, partial [Alphaproteobacteria bacterium]